MKRSIPALLCAATLCATPLMTAPSSYAQQASGDKGKSASQKSIPLPNAVPNGWSLAFESTTPDTFTIKKADGSVDWYWYFTYKVTNYDAKGQEVFFEPRITVQNDTGEIIQANLGIAPHVFREVQDLVHNPLLRSPVDIAGIIFKGEDYTRHGVAIWKASKADVDAFKVFVGGLFGEVKTVRDPRTGKPIMVPVISALTGKPKKDFRGKPQMQPLLLRRQRMMHYRTPGTVKSLQNPTIKLIANEDVMR